MRRYTGRVGAHKVVQREGRIKHADQQKFDDGEYKENRQQQQGRHHKGQIGQLFPSFQSGQLPRKWPFRRAVFFLFKLLWRHGVLSCQA